MAISVKIPKDTTRIPSKIIFNLTLRQLVCFGIGIAVSVPVFFVAKNVIGMETAVIFCMIIASPFFISGIYEKNGSYIEEVLYFIVRQKVFRSGIRMKETETIESREERKHMRRKEIETLEEKAGNGRKHTKTKKRH